MNKKLLVAVLVISLLTAITFLFFSHVILSTGQFYFGDMSQNHYPARKLMAELQKEGNGLLWNPYITGGQPLYANPSYLFFHPVSLLFLFLPFEFAFKSSIILQYLLCAFGVYLLSRELNLSLWAALLSSIAFTFSGFFLSLGHLYNLLGSAAWIPFFLFFFYRSVHRSLHYWPVAALFFVVILIAADPFFIAAAVLLSLSLMMLQPLRHDPPRKFRRVGTAILIFGSALLLSSFFLLPALEMFSLSGRGAGLSEEVIGKWSLKPIEMLGFFIPNIFGDPFRLPVGDYWGGFSLPEVIPLFLSSYMGLCIFFLAILPFFKWDRFAILFCILMIFSVFLALGVNNPLFPSDIWKIPLLFSFRYTSKFLLLSTFAVALLAGKGFDQLMNFRQGHPSNPGMEKGRGWLLIIPILTTVGLALFYYSALFFPALFHDFLQRMLHLPGNLPAIISSSISTQFLGKVLYASGIALTGALLIFLTLFSRIKKGLMACLFIAVITCDLFIVNGGLNPIAKKDFYAAPSPFLRALSENEQGHRIFRENTPKDLMLRISEGWKKEGFFWNRMVLLQWTALPVRLFFAFDKNVDRLEPYAPTVLMREAKKRGWLTWRKILSLSSVKHLLLFEKVEDPNLTKVMEFNAMSNYPVVLYENNKVFPRIFAVPRVMMVQDEKDALQEILSDRFQPQEEAVIIVSPDDRTYEEMRAWNAGFPKNQILEKTEGVKENAGELSEKLYRIEIQEKTIDSLRLLVRAKQPGLLIVSDTFYPGWICRIDDRAVTIYRTNFIHRGVLFEEGEHIVEFHFKPKIFYLGIMISIISILVIIGFLLFFYIRERKNQ